MILVFLMEQNTFPQECFKIIQHLYQLKNTLIFSSGTTQIDLQKSNEVSEENIESITKSGSNFAPTFIGHHVLLDIKKMKNY